jgi:metal transporter CNNM
MGWIVDILSQHFVIIAGDFADYQEMEDFFNTVMACICVMCAGLAAGLTMGLLSLDVTKLEIKCRVGDAEEKLAAAAVLPIVKQHHLLLVTLLLFNSIANETLPIFLGQLVPNYLAIILAVFLILIFGEIIPSAFFTGVHQLQTSAKLVPTVYFLMAVLYPVAYPISKLLDKFFGEDEEEGGGAMTRSELEALVLMQQDSNKLRDSIRKELDDHCGEDSNSNNETVGDFGAVVASAAALSAPGLLEEGGQAGTAETEHAEKKSVSWLGSSSKEDVKNSSKEKASKAKAKSKRLEDGLSSSEVNLMLGVLNLSKFTVGHAMIRREDVYMASSSYRLDDSRALHEILESGFSRIPVYYRTERDILLGYMLVKELIVVRTYM